MKEFNGGRDYLDEYNWCARERNDPRKTAAQEALQARERQCDEKLREKGFRLSRGQTPTDVLRGEHHFQIENIATGEVVCGRGFTLAIWGAEGFLNNLGR